MEDQEALVSRVVQATSASRSLRVTIPHVVASTLDLHPGDEIAWILEPGGPSVRVERRSVSPTGEEPEATPSER